MRTSCISEAPSEKKHKSKVSKAKHFLEAARAGDVSGLRKLIATGHIPINCSDIHHKTAMMYAASFGKNEAVEFLLSQEGIDVAALDDTQKSALHHAARPKRKTRGSSVVEEVPPPRSGEIVNMLVKAGAAIEARDHNGCTALLFAVGTGDSEVVRCLLEHGSSVNVRDYEGQTPAMYARNSGLANSDQMVQLLIEGGLNQEREHEEDDADRGGATPKERRRRSSSGITPSAAKIRAARKTSITISLSAPDPELEILAADGEGGGEGADRDPELAVLALEQVLSNVNASIRDLETAIAIARRAGVAKEELEPALLRLEEVRRVTEAVRKLQEAVDMQDVPALIAALAAAEGLPVPEAEIEAARAALAVEAPRARAREALCRARDYCDAKGLGVALADAHAAGVDPFELAEFEELLRGAEHAEAQVRQAMESRNVHALKFALSQAESAAAVSKQLLAEAQALLKIEEPRHEARMKLAEAVDSGKIEGLRLAISEGKHVGLEAWELGEAADLLAREERKVEALKMVRQALVDSQDVVMTSVEALRTGRDMIRDRLREAKDAGCQEVDLREADLRRRRLHNAIEDLKGSIRVYCRVRPISQKEQDRGDAECTWAEDSTTVQVQAIAKAQMASSFTGAPPAEEIHSFQFDAVFDPGTQQEVFEECMDLVQSAADGFNVTIFAYGQTGAGKTFTMYGCPGQEGTCPRTVRELFNIIARQRDRFTFTVMASMSEMYRNELVDLLAEPSEVSKKLDIKVDQASGAVIVNHLTELQCQNENDLTELIRRGESRRTVAATKMNSSSSRSHLMLSVKIVSVNRETHEQLVGKLILVDLAGSERLKKSEVTGEQQKEAIEINKSLTALGDVIEGIGKGLKLVPYRNHKLTQMMQDSIGGSAKTLMFCNISPAIADVGETLMSLKYATRAKKITNQVKKTSK